MVDVEAVETLMEEPLEVSVDTELLCRLASADSASFVVERVLTGGADRYDQQSNLLGVEEELSGVGDRAFRSGYIYGVQLGEQYVAVTFAIFMVLDADARLAIVTDIVEGL